MLASDAAQIVVIGSVPVAYAARVPGVFLIRTVHLRPASAGVLLALGAAGGVAAGLAARSLTRRIGSARISWLSMTVFSLPGLLIPLVRPGWWVLLFAAGWIAWTFELRTVQHRAGQLSGHLLARAARPGQRSAALDQLGHAAAGRPGRRRAGPPSACTPRSGSQRPAAARPGGGCTCPRCAASATCPA
jgi:hypothetical protein